MKKSLKPCDCVTQVNAKLAESGQRLSWEISIDFSSGKSSAESPLLRVEWSSTTKKRGRLPTITCSYCPFCGKKKP